jgi:signal peptidase II
MTSRPDVPDRARSTPSRTRRIALAAAVVATTLIADLLTKAWAWNTLRLQGAKSAIAGVLHFEFSFNTGSAFGMFRDASWGHGFFIAVILVAVLVLARLALRLPTDRAAPFVGIGLAMGGALGNLHDRLFRELLIVGEGFRPGVVDFIVVFLGKGRRWPAFNIADVVLLVGVALIFHDLSRHAAADDTSDAEA